METSGMKVTLVDSMGTDLSIVNAARVSFNKKSDWEEVEYGAYEDDPIGWVEKVLSGQDKKLIKYLAKHNHWTPFAHTAITLHVKAPLFVARQLGKHQVGLVWNEVSRRYVTDALEFYVPEVWRKAAENVKQGSSDEPASIESWWVNDFEIFAPEVLVDVCANYYNMLVEDGVCPEQARMVLPQSMYTEWYWTGNLYSFYNVYKLRTDPHTQKETQEIAYQIGEVMGKLYPVAWEALCSKD